MMNNRKALIAGNWKLHKTVTETISTVEKLNELVVVREDREVMIAPPFTSIWAAHGNYNPEKLSLGAQDVFWEEKGAFTGEISPAMLESAGCSYVLIGHSERRQFFGETDQTVNSKIKAVLDSSLVPVLCVGETLEERQENRTFTVLEGQITKGLDGISNLAPDRLVLAYEPVWSIGTGKTAGIDQVMEVHSFVRALIEKMFGGAAASSVRILYGGSVKPENISELMALDDVDGALVGGASLSPEIFAEIINF